MLLIIVTFVGTSLALYGVPWQVSGDPCVLAAGATVVLLAFLWVTRWLGSRAVIFELAAFLVGTPLVYVTRYLFASTGHAANFWLWVEVLGIPIFAGHMYFPS